MSESRREPAFRVQCVAFAPSGDAVATGNRDDANTGAHVRTVEREQ